MATCITLDDQISIIEVNHGLPGDDGVVASIVAGTNVTVDDTDPANPIVSAQVPGGVGDMSKAVYDPNTKEADAFDMANMDESAIEKILTADERTDIEASASFVETSPAVAASGIAAFVGNHAFSSGFSTVQIGSGSPVLFQVDVGNDNTIVFAGTVTDTEMAYALSRFINNESAPGGFTFLNRNFTAPVTSVWGGAAALTVTATDLGVAGNAIITESSVNSVDVSGYDIFGNSTLTGGADEKEVLGDYVGYEDQSALSKSSGEKAQARTNLGLGTAATSDTGDFDASGSAAAAQAFAIQRANHTGTQTASTISDFDTEVGNNSAVAANTAKATNVTTNLSIGTTTATTLDVDSSDGTNATIPQAVATSAAGLLSGADKEKLDGIESSADVTDAANVTTAIEASGGYIEQQTLSDAATILFNADNGVNAQVTLTASRTLGEITGLAVGQSGSLTVIQGGAGGWALTLDATQTDMLGTLSDISAQATGGEAEIAFRKSATKTKLWITAP